MKRVATPSPRRVPFLHAAWDVLDMLVAEGFHVVRSAPHMNRRGAVVLRVLLRKDIPGQLPVTVRVSVSTPAA